MEENSKNFSTFQMCEDNNAMLATSNYNQSDRLVHHFLFAFMGKKRNCHLPA
jgi:hypothetical protein